MAVATRDLVHRIGTAITLSPASRTANATGTGVDLSGFHSAAVVIQAGTITDGTHTIEIQDSDDNAAFAAVADDRLQGTEPSLGTADSDSVIEIGYVGYARYVRAIVTVTGATSGGVYGVSVVRGRAEAAS